MADEMKQDEVQQMEAPNGNEQTDETTTDPSQFTQEEKDAMMEDDDDTEDDRKLFVGGLSWDTAPKELREYFEKFGEVTNCTLKTDYLTKKSRGFAFVCFASPEPVEKVLASKEHKLHGRNIDPKKATPRPKKIFVGKLDPAVVEDDVKAYFSNFGEVEKMEFPFDKNKEQRRAFCFVEFKRMSGLKKCLEETSHKIKGQEVDVKKATPPQSAGNAMRGGPRGRGGFGGVGRGGGRGGFDGGYNNYNQGGYGGYGGYGYGYDQGYGNYPGYGNDGYYGGGYSYGWNNGGGYDQGFNYGYGNQSNFGKSQKRGAGQGGYHPYNR